MRHPSELTNSIIKLREKLKKSHCRWVKIIYSIKYQRLCGRLNCFIPVSAAIPESTIFPHGLNGVYISQGAILGESCVVFHQVTIGSNSLKDSKGFGSPKLGNNVYIGAGAKIIGGIKIGNNVRIGANVVVTNDIPDNSTVVAVPARLILHDEERKNTFNPYQK